MPRPNWANDPTIPPDARLWRGVVVPDDIRSDANGNDIPSLGSLITGEMSVQNADETDAAQMLARGAAAGLTWKIWEFTAGDARAAGLIVDRDPLPGDPGHCIVVRSDAPGKRIRESQAKQLVQCGRWVN